MHELERKCIQNSEGGPCQVLAVRGNLGIAVVRKLKDDLLALLKTLGWFIREDNQRMPQGSPLSLLIPNIVLNEWDPELEWRGLRYACWADDSVILVKTERSAHRVTGGVSRYLEETLGLKVNREKGEVAPMKSVTFLGFQVLRENIRVSNKSREKFKERIRRLTKRNNPLSMHRVIHELNLYLRGWCGYFRIQEFHNIFRDLDAWIRSRLRSVQLKKWKNPRKFQRIMCQAGMPVGEAR